MNLNSILEPNNTITTSVVLIPALSPDRKLIELTHQVLALGLQHVIIVDDGSDEVSAPIFSELNDIPLCTVLYHNENLGKGRALKTGMQFFLANFPNSVGIVTADCDGQHTPSDIKAIADELQSNANSLILGVRDFASGEVPAKSRFGNILTKRLFTFLTGLSIADTQTGLRGIPASKMKLFCSLKGERFEYELNMLLACKQHHISIFQFQINTIYLNHNNGTHFNPFIDSIRVYSVFLKFISSSLLSFLIDYGSFLLCLMIFDPLIRPAEAVLLAGFVSRVLSSTANYAINRLSVFKSQTQFSTVRYYILCSVLMIVSSSMVMALHLIFGGGAPFFKILVDSLLFLGSFTFQRDWVFASKDKRRQKKNEFEQILDRRVKHKNNAS